MHAQKRQNGIKKLNCPGSPVRKQCDSDIKPEVDRKARLAACEKQIAEGLQSFWELASTFYEVKADKLYEPGYASFEAYCKLRWGFSRSYGDRYVQSAKVFKNLKLAPIGAKISLPKNEAQVREISGLSAEQQVAVAEKVYESVGDGPLSYLHFRQAKHDLHLGNKTRAKAQAANAPLDISATTVSAEPSAESDPLGDALDLWRGICDDLRELLILLKDEEDREQVIAHTAGLLTSATGLHDVMIKRAALPNRRNNAVAVETPADKLPDDTAGQSAVLSGAEKQLPLDAVSSADSTFPTYSSACSFCGEALDDLVGDTPCCSNPECAATIKARLVWWCSPQVMEGPRIKEPLLQHLIEFGARTPADLYVAAEAGGSPNPGLNQIFEELYHKLWKTKAKGLATVLFGLAIPAMDFESCRLLARLYPDWQALEAASADEIIAQKDLGDEAKWGFLKWRSKPDNQDLMVALADLGVSLKSADYQAANPSRGKLDKTPVDQLNTKHNF